MFRAVLLGLALTWAASADAAQPAGRLISLEGEVAVRLSGATQWQKAQLRHDLFGGDTVRTGANSRAAILCLDESQIRLNQHTVLTLKSVAVSPRLRFGEIAPAVLAQEAGSFYQVIEGEVWLRNKKEKFLFELETPTVTATIRGTELNIRVQPDGTTTIVMLEGEVKLANRYGEVVVAAGEEGLTQPGKPPTKQVLVQPMDAVQWTLFYPGFFSYRDLPLQALDGARPSPGGGCPTALPSQGVAAYDQGKLQEAGAIADQALATNPTDQGALTLVGWVSLQRREPQEALKFFQRVSQPGAPALVGTALARHQTGDTVGGYDLMQTAHKLYPGNPVVTVMAGYFTMLLGRAEEARRFFKDADQGSSHVAKLLARCYLAQMDIVQNRKDEARSQAEGALAQDPLSPLALLTMGLVKQSFFELPKAIRFLEKAVQADPRFVDAYVYLVRMWLGSEYLNRALHTVETALKIAPRQAEVLAIAGFVRLAFRDYRAARDFFDQAIQANPNLGDPYLGRGYVHFRYRSFDQGLTEMLTATLLDPRISLYQSEVGKAYYQMRAFDKALATWDYAAKLDPKDPTPHLYRGIALTDLNRPGEAIQEINQSIALNDNTAIFRTRLALDQDRAVRNYNLARAYDQLGLREWAYSKALTAVKNDPYNASAHLFLSKSFATAAQGPYISPSVDAEDQKFRILSPANENTFQSIRNDNYTPMFEMPYFRLLATGSVGAWRERGMIQEYDLDAYGGLPGLGFNVRGNYVDDQGFRSKTAAIRSYSTPLAFAKWEPTVNNSIQGEFAYLDNHFGDVLYQNDYFYPNNPYAKYDQRARFYDISFFHTFNPVAKFLAYYTYQKWDFYHLTLPDYNGGLFTADSGREFHNLQLQQYLVLGKHNLIMGFSYFTGRFLYSQSYSLMGFPFPGYSLNLRPAGTVYSYYLYDFWRIHPKLLIELGLIKDFARSVQDGFTDPLYNSQWNPIIGLNYYINSHHTLRFALQRHMMTSGAWGAHTLIPTETAGFPWLFTSLAGTDIRTAGVSWEAEWNPKTFSVLTLNANRFSVPEYNAMGDRTWQTWKTYLASFVVNRILATPWGLSFGAQGERVIPDVNFFLTPWTYNQPYRDYWDVRSFLALRYLNSEGWQGGVKVTLLQQYLKGWSDGPFALVDLTFGKEFAKKRGMASIEVTNLFNQHFFFVLEPNVFNQTIYPARRILFKLAFYF